MSMVENSVAMIEEREKEITAIVQSILHASRGTGESRETPKEIHQMQTYHHSSAGCSHCPGYSRTHH